MSRAMNIDLSEAEVLAACAKHGALVSASEPLPSGGARVVLINTEGAETMRKVFRNNLMVGAVTRTPFNVRRPS